MEKYNGYIINERDVAGTSGFFASKTKVELEAKVIPDAELIYEYMRSMNVVKRSWDDIVYDIEETVDTIGVNKNLL